MSFSYTTHVRVSLITTFLIDVWILHGQNAGVPPRKPPCTLGLPACCDAAELPTIATVHCCPALAAVSWHASCNMVVVAGCQTFHPDADGGGRVARCWRQHH